jgi:hypothetical protein
LRLKGKRRSPSAIPLDAQRSAVTSAKLITSYAGCGLTVPAFPCRLFFPHCFSNPRPTSLVSGFSTASSRHTSLISRATGLSITLLSLLLRGTGARDIEGLSSSTLNSSHYIHHSTTFYGFPSGYFYRCGLVSCGTDQ